MKTLFSPPQPLSPDPRPGNCAVQFYIYKNSEMVLRFMLQICASIYQDPPLLHFVHWEAMLFLILCRNGLAADRRFIFVWYLFTQKLCLWKDIFLHFFCLMASYFWHALQKFCCLSELSSCSIFLHRGWLHDNWWSCCNTGSNWLAGPRLPGTTFFLFCGAYASLQWRADANMAGSLIYTLLASIELSTAKILQFILFFSINIQSRPYI